MNNKIIISVLVVVLLVISVTYYFRSNLGLCGLTINNEGKEICYLESALKSKDSSFCSNIETVYRKNRCVQLIESEGFSPEEIESILKSL